MQHGKFNLPALLFLASAILLIGCRDQRLKDLERRVSELEAQSRQNSPGLGASPADEFEKQKRKDRHKLLKANYAIRGNLPMVISYFKDRIDEDKTRQDSVAIEAETHQEILKLCDQLSEIVRKIIATKANRSIGDEITLERSVFKNLDALLENESVEEKRNRYQVSQVSEYKANLIRIDIEDNRKVLDLLKL